MNVAEVCSDGSGLALEYDECATLCGVCCIMVPVLSEIPTRKRESVK